MTDPVFVRRLRCLLVLLAFAVPAGNALGAPQSAAGDSGGLTDFNGVLINGPAPAAPPASVSRDAQGRVTMRATRVSEPIVLDGRLDEPVYQQVQPASDFIQQEPLEGEPATERTEVWLFFDQQNVYVSARMFDSEPDRIIANEMRRDNRNIFFNDSFGVAFDTFHNQRTGFFFQTNALGGLRDALVSDEGQPNYDWDTVWDVRSRRFEQGWTTEILIPFKSLRFEGSGEQVWGVNFRRVVPWKNETSYLTRIPASYGGRGITMFSLAAPLVGIDPPGGYRNLELKPYVISEVLTNRAADPPVTNDLDGDFGLDVKYGLTRSLIADFTYNTDFAQVEDDEQQVNLTRFSLFFPEKREFFLEGQGIFEFGGVRGGGFGGGGNAPILFFSRRIGLQGGQSVPILAGGRLTGRAGPYSVGVLNIQTKESEAVGAESTNFSVVRLRRDVLRRSNIGVLMTRRSPTLDTGGSNEVYGLDANMAFFQDLEVSAYYARSDSPELSGDEDSYRGQFEYNSDRYGLELQHLKVGRNFDPQIGFMRREDFRENSGSVRFSPRPEAIEWLRKVSWQAEMSHIADLEGRLETREQEFSFGMELESGDQARFEYTRSYELLKEPFEVADDIVLPIGGYGFDGVRADYELGPQRKVSGQIEFSTGGFFSGERTEVGYSGRIEVSPRFSLEPRVSVNWIDLPVGSFTTELFTARATFTMSPRMFVGALVQYNSSNDALTSNVRFRWEYEPGSDLFIVYSEGRDTLTRGVPDLLNRGFVVKYTRLFRF